METKTSKAPSPELLLISSPDCSSSSSPVPPPGSTEAATDGFVGGSSMGRVAQNSVADASLHCLTPVQLPGQGLHVLCRVGRHLRLELPEIQ